MLSASTVPREPTGARDKYSQPDSVFLLGFVRGKGNLADLLSGSREFFRERKVVFYIQRDQVTSQIMVATTDWKRGRQQPPLTAGQLPASSVYSSFGQNQTASQKWLPSDTALAQCLGGVTALF